MGNQRGSTPAGVSGVINAPGVSGSGIEYRGECLAWSFRNAGKPRPRAGRGTTGKYFALRIAGKEGGGIIKGQIASNAWPAPDSELEGAAISIVRQFAAGKTVTTPAVVTSFEQSFNEKTGDIADFALTYVTTGPPVYAGWSGTQPTAAAPTKTDQQQWLDTIKGYDPQGIAPPATQSLIDWWGDIANTDAAEKDKLLEVIAAAAVPLDAPHDYKLRGATFGRDCIDGGTIILSWGLTDTKDDVEMPATGYQVDEANIFGQVSIRQVQEDNQIDWPETPAEPSNLKHGRVDKLELNDSRWALTYHFVRNNSEDVIELDGAHTGADPNDLGETARIILVTTSSTPPTAPDAPVGQLVATDSRPITVANGDYTGYWAHVFDYGGTTKLQAIEFDGDYVEDKSTTGGIVNSQVIPVVSGSSSAPSEPTARKLDSDLKLVRRRARRIQGTSEKWVHVFEYARNTSEDEREHTRRNIDANDFGEQEVIPVLHTSGSSAPSTPAQVGTSSNTIDTTVERLCVASGSFTGLWLWTFHFGPNTRKHEIEQQGILTVDSDGHLDDTETVVIVSDSVDIQASPGATGDAEVLVAVKSRRLQNNPQKWEQTFYYGYRNSHAKLEAAHTETNADTSSLKSTATTADVWLVSSGAPSTPTLSGYVLRFSRDVETNNPLYRLRIYSWGLTTTEEDEEMGGTVYVLDQSSNVVDGYAEVTVVESDDTPDGGVSVSGLILRDHRKKQLNSNKWAITYIFGQRTHEQDITLLKSVYENDPSGLESRAVVAMVNASSTYPVALDTPPVIPTTGTLQRTGIKTHKHTDAGKWVHVAVYELATTAQKIEYAGTDSAAHIEEGYRRKTASIITSTDSVDTIVAGLVAANKSTSSFVAAEAKRLNPNKVLQTLITENRDYLIELQGAHSVRQLVRGVPESALPDFPTIHYVPGNISVNDPNALQYIKYNFGNLLVKMQEIDRVLGRFILWRLWAVDDYNDKTFWAIQGHINADTFLGRLAGEVKYVGPIGAWNLSDTDTKRFLAGYQFATDNYKWFSDGTLADGSVAVRSGIIESTGYYSATNIETGDVCDWPDSADFDGFTDP